MSSNYKYTAVLADNHRDCLRIIKTYLYETGKFDVVDYAFDGRAAVELMIEYRPDLLVADLIMPKLDCFAVLEELLRRGYQAPTKVVMTTAVGLDFVMKRAESYGVDYIFMKPFEKEVFKRRIIDLMDYKPLERVDFGHRKSAMPIDIVTRHIKMVGITANVKGYHYLRDAILMVYKDFDLISRLTSDLYVNIARKYGSTPQCVERAMRHAIETAFGRADLSVLQSFFGYTILDTKGKPTNGEFIAMLADKLSTELKYVD